MTAPAKILEALRKTALALPETDEGVACEGTALERRTIRVAKKAFLFLGTGDAMLKLGASLGEAQELGAVAGVRAGAGGWVKIVFANAKPPATKTLQRWVAESHALVAAPAKKKVAAKKKPAAKRKSAR